MANRKSFTDYMAEAQARQPIVQAKAKPADQDFLSWAIDIVSRPMRAVTNAPNQIFNEMKKAEEARRAGKEYDVLGGIGNVATAPLRGFFSTDVEDQPLGSDLIEKGTDAFGLTYNKDYQDVQDNVNPVVKGVGGFVLDVGLDPLTYIPGGIAVAGLRGGVAGVKAAGGVDKIAAFTKGIMEGAPGATKLGGISKAIKPVGVNQWKDLRSYEKVTKVARKNNVQIDALLAMKAGESATAVSKKIKAGEYGDVVSKKGEVLKPTTAVPKLKEVFSQTEKRLSGVENIDKIKAGIYAEQQAAKASQILAKLADETSASDAPVVAKTVEKAAEDVQKTVPQTAVDEVVATADTTLADAFAPYAPKVSQQLAKAEPKVVKVAGEKPAPLNKNEFMSSLRNSPLSPESSSEAKLMYDQYLKDFARSETGVDSLGLSLPTPPKVEKWVKPSEALAKLFSNPKAGAQFTEAIGGVATKYLSTLAKEGKEAEIRTASNFMKEVISGERSLNDIMEWTASPEHQFAKRIFENYKIDVPGTNARRLEGVSQANLPATVDDAVAAAKGVTLADQPWRAGLTQEQVDAVIEVLPEELAAILKLDGFDFTTVRKNVARTSDVAGEGFAKYTDEVNTAWQTQIYTKLVRYFATDLGIYNDEMRAAKNFAAVKAGGRRSGDLNKDTLNAFSLFMHFLDTKGASAWLGFGENRVRLYLDQMIEVLRDTAYADMKSSQLVNMAILNADTMLPLTNIVEAVVETQLKTGKSISSILRQPVGKGKNMAKNVLIDTEMTGRYGFRPGDKKPANTEFFSFEAKLYDKGPKKGKVKGYYPVVKRDAFEKALIQLIEDSSEQIAKVIGDNEGMATARAIADEKYLTPAVRETLQQAATSGPETEAGIRALANIGAEAGRVGKAQKVTPEAQATSTKNLVDSRPPQEIHDAQAIVNHEKTMNATNDPKLKPAEQAAKEAEVATKNSVEDSAYYSRMGEQLVNTAKREEDGFDAAGNVVDEIAHDLAIKNAGMQLGIASKLDGFFNIARGVEDVIQPYKRTELALTSGLAKYEQGLDSVMRKHSGFVAPGSKTTKVEQAFRDIAMGKAAKEGDEVRKDLEPFINRVFGVEGSRGTTSLWVMGNASIDDFEAYVRRAGIEFPFEMDMVKKWADEQGISMVQAAMDKWSTWAKDIDDPMTFLKNMHYGAGLMIADKQAANLFQKIPGAISNGPAAGFKKLPDNFNPFEHPFLSHVPKGTYMSEELIEQIKKVEKLAMESKGFKGDFGKFINEVYTPILGNWKFGVTVLRLGHHVRNFFSDSSIQMFEEGLKNFGRSHAEAQRGLSLMRNFKDVDWAKQLTNLGDLEMTTEGKRFTSSKWGEITHGAMVEAYTKHGGPVTYKQSEDVIGDTKTPGIIQKISNVLALRGTKIAEKAGQLSEFQNNTNRMAHFYQFVLNNKDKGVYKTWDELVTAGMEKVRRCHPDASMLATGERKLRLIFPFYTWFRLAAPVIAEGILARPGRFMAIPKASYNMAVAMGIDPVSLSEPFPTDQLFPSFLREGMTGPIVKMNGSYYYTNAGIPYLDMVNQFIANPGKGIAGMINPFLKVPVELATGAQLGSGTKIKDLSDYVDSNLPGLNYLANITGLSVTGTPYSLATGKGVDTQYSVNAGNKTPFDQFITASNWVTGLGLQNYSKPNYINYAEIEQRNKAAAEKSTRSPY